MRKSIQQAQTIYRQLGANKFSAMVGAKKLVFGERKITFQIGRNQSKANFVQIELEKDDTYTMKFYKLRGVDFVLQKNIFSVYADQLTTEFTNFTGLYTSL